MSFFAVSLHFFCFPYFFQLLILFHCSLHLCASEGVPIVLLHFTFIPKIHILSAELFQRECYILEPGWIAVPLHHSSFCPQLQQDLWIWLCIFLNVALLKLFYMLSMLYCLAIPDWQIFGDLFGPFVDKPQVYHELFQQQHNWEKPIQP